MPKLSLIGGAAGSGKTSDLISAMGNTMRGFLGADRVGFCGLFVGDLLAAEYTINKSFPMGLASIPDGSIAEFNRDGFPQTHEELFARLPPSIRELKDARGSPRWTLGKLRAVVTDLRAFYINAISPWSTDARFDFISADAGPNWMKDNTWAQRYAHSPNAVLQFRAREDLCPAGHHQRRLDEANTCRECPLIHCRANTNEGGSKRLWHQCGVALFSHKAFEMQEVYQPKNNEVTRLFIDEIPQSVYRNPKLRVYCEHPKARRSTWRVEPIDTVLEKLTEFENGSRWSDLGPVVQRLERQRALLLKRAQKTQTERGGKGVERMACEMEPLLSTADFALLVEAQGGHHEPVDDQSDDTPTDAELGRGSLGTLLLRLRDFCADKPFWGWYENSFAACDRSGSFYVRKPTSGWREVAFTPRGKPRRVWLADATSGMDSRYLLLAAEDFDFERVPEGTFENTSIVCTTSRRSTISKRKLTEMSADEIVEKVIHDVAQFRPKFQRLLIVTNKDTRADVEPLVNAAVEDGRLPRGTRVDHFGNMRGVDRHHECDAVYFTHLHRYDEGFYNGLAFLRKNPKTLPGKFAPKSDAAWSLETIRYRSMCCDLYQDAMRILLRRNHQAEAFIFLPTTDIAVAVRMLRLFKGSRLLDQSGQEILTRPLPRPSPADARDEVPDARPPLAVDCKLADCVLDLLSHGPLVVPEWRALAHALKCNLSDLAKVIRWGLRTRKLARFKFEGLHVLALPGDVDEKPKLCILRDGICDASGRRFHAINVDLSGFSTVRDLITPWARAVAHMRPISKGSWLKIGSTLVQSWSKKTTAIPEPIRWIITGRSDEDRLANLLLLNVDWDPATAAPGVEFYARAEFATQYASIVMKGRGNAFKAGCHYYDEFAAARFPELVRARVRTTAEAQQRLGGQVGRKMFDDMVDEGRFR